MSKTILRKTARRERFFRYALLVVWIAVIFIASSNAGSMSNTSRFIRPVLEWLFPHASEETLTAYHAFIRKLAHVTEYAILAFWASRAFINSAKLLPRKFWFALAFVVVLLVACADEFNQSFNAARTSSVYDVLLDCAGGAMMIFIFYLIKYKTKNRK
ncbi:MAG: VanZ family protein [Pyrinomonadaceae bacterium]